MKLNIIAIAGFAITILSACNIELMGNDTYTLYRGNTMTGNLRIHLATFDSAASLPDYEKNQMSFNYLNCVRAANLFQSQQPASAGTRYWCERGSYKK